MIGVRPRTKRRRFKKVVIYKPGSVLQRVEQALKEREKVKDRAFMQARRDQRR